jgi:hypothetical protein
MNEFERLIQVFGYETDGGRRSRLWNEPRLFSNPIGQGGKDLDDALAAWQATKRELRREEMLAGSWAKVGDHGHSFIVTFHTDGSLTECGLFDMSSTQRGTWLMVGKAIRTRVSRYELDIFGSREGRMHSGIEFEDGQRKPTAYFEIIHL